MKVLVCGSRHFNDKELLHSVLDKINITTIIQGEARGADTMGREYAEERRLNCLSFPAEWDKHGKRAGPIRNYQMLKEGKPDLVVAFLAPNSRGTKHMIEIAQKAGVPVEIIHIDNKLGSP